MTGIRCDANSIIASGHMMRCLTIAKELVRLGESVTFFVADDESKALFDAYVGDLGSSIDVVVLGTNWQDMESELKALIPELGKRNIDRLLVDSYKVTVPYFEKIKEICPVAYLDDLNEATYPVDMLINYSGYYKSLGYEETYKNVCGYNGVPTKLLLGLQYAPLREQFYHYSDAPAESLEKHGAENRSAAESVVSSEDQNSETAISVLLTSGGADTQGMLLATLSAAEKAGLIKSDDSSLEKSGTGKVNVLPRADWHVVVGSLVKDATAIEKFAEIHAGIIIHRAVTDMAGLMRQCDIAVCAAGTMLTECAAIGLPAIFYQVADNQKYNVDYWSSTGGMKFAGNVETDKSAVVRSICAELSVLLADMAKLEYMRSKLAGITDGRGAILIAKALMEMKK
ncbi:PseG/SpsG family protein [Butyrivibrio sp. AE2032]|uniref:PseG/SpsG family protein n=1 Tax=Butyrivibrio sp. AE2032 TaxID=1458463 RepID=UPI000551BF7B|nr:DUF354 domain-containing protein [Butyrivibrio sp. AE2032]